MGFENGKHPSFLFVFLRDHKSFYNSHLSISNLSFIHLFLLDSSLFRVKELFSLFPLISKILLNKPIGLLI